MLLASSLWIFPTPVHAQEAKTNIEIKEEIKEPTEIYGPDRPLDLKKSVVPKKTNRPAGVAKVHAGNEVQPDAVRQNYSKEEVQQLIVQYSLQYGINPEVPLCIAKAESGFNHLAKNKSSSVSGVFQYLTSTWKGTDEGRAGLSVFDAEANVRAAIKYMASRRSTSPWVVGPKCSKL